MKIQRYIFFIETGGSLKENGIVQDFSAKTSCWLVYKNPAKGLSDTFIWLFSVYLYFNIKPYQQVFRTKPNLKMGKIISCINKKPEF